MAKRKRPILQTPSRKRAKGSSLAHPHGNIDPNREYKLRSIVGEDPTRYLISWEDDEETGEKFDDSWEPKANANREAVADWEKQKANKKRLQRLSRQASGSRSSTPQSATPKKAAAAPRKAGRPRNVIQSSSPVAEEPRTNGDREQAQQITNDLLEIGESQHTESSPQQAAGAANGGPDSPLFVPAESPTATELPDPDLATVQVTDPPSSYFAGAYEPVSPSQPAPSSNIPLDTSPERSQYVPDPADTSKTTDDTEISLAPTTPSGQTRSVPVNFGRSSTTKIVPDSQSLLGSTSYVPSTTTAISSSAPEASRQTGISGDHAPAQITGQEELGDSRHGASTSPSHPEDQSSAQIVEEQAEVQIADATSPARDTTPAAGDTRLYSALGSTVPNLTELPNFVDDTTAAQRTPEVGGSSQGDEVLREGEAEQLVSPLNGAPERSEQNEVVHKEGEPAGVDSPSSPLQVSIGSEEAAEHRPLSQSQDLSESGELTPNPGVPLQPTSAQPHVNQTESSNDSSATNKNPEKDGTETEHLDSSTQPEVSHPPTSQGTSQARQATVGAYLQDEPLSAQNNPLPQSESLGVPGATTAVDLETFTQDQQTSVGRFLPTPPPRRLHSLNPEISLQPLNSSAWQASLFPFETQILRPRSAGSAVSAFFSGRSGLQSQPLAESHSRSNLLSQNTLRAQSLPPGQFSPLPLSSSIPQPPSQSKGLGAFGESAPPRPTTPSSPLRAPSATSSMNGSQPNSGSGGSLKERLKAMRERTRRASALQRDETPTPAPTCNSNEVPPRDVQQPSSTEPSAPTVAVASQAPITVTEPGSAIPARLKSPLLRAQAGRRSPSAVPHLEPLPVITQDEMSNSGRYETLLPQAQDYGGDDKQRNGSLTVDGTPSGELNGTLAPDSTNLYTIPISMSGHQRDQYPSTVYFHRETIERFLATDKPDAELVSKAKHFVNRMRYIAMHPDLDNAETLTQYDVEPSQQANWDVSCSAKFRFLKELFDSLRNDKLHIVIVASPGRIVDILETFLQGISVAYQRPATFSSSETASKGKIMATLLDTDAELTVANPADIVIAMDNFVRHDAEYIRALRQRGTRWAPFVSLVVPCTVEHVERCLSPHLSDRAASRALVSGIYQYTKGAGRLEDGQQPPKDTAVMLANYLKHIGEGVEWPLVPLSALQDLGSQTESEVAPLATNGIGVEPSYIGEKRSRESDDMASDAVDSNKRVRIAVSVATVEDAEITHISDSLDKTTQPDDIGAGVTTPELGNTEKRLQDLLQQTQNRLDEHVQALSDLQYRFEEQRNRLIEVTNERDKAIATAQQAVTRYSEQSNNMSHHRVKQSELEQQLTDMKERLVTHTIPERAELESVRLDAALANVERTKLDQRLQQAQKDLEYIRGLYQDSSSQAQQLATQTIELENQLALLQNRATGEQAKLRQMGYDSFTKNLQNENRKLKSIVKDREAALKFRDEEIARLKEASRGRMGTRGTSVPRSPRIGSPRMGSRQTSPATGELRGRSGLLHPLRNA